MIKQLLDKICFACGVIVFLQLPHFIDQYTQRIGGYAESKQQQLNQYQSIANRNFNGDLELLIDGFKRSNDAAVRETGRNISLTQTDVMQLQKEITVLNEQSLLKKTLFLTTHLRINLAKGTLRVFQPGVPLNLWALLYGLAGGLLFSLLFNGCIQAPKIILKKKKRTSIYSNQ